MAKGINDPKSVTEYIHKLEPDFAKLIEAINVEIIPVADHITGASRPDLTNDVILKFLGSIS